MSSRHVALVLVTLTAAASCGRTQTRAQARRVILITCDTLRADHLGVYGYARPTSPSVDAFAADATVFEEACSSAPLTVPSLASLFSGLLPDETGVSLGNRSLLPPEVVTLPEILAPNGIATAAVVSNWVLRRPSREQGDEGLQQGFAWYDDAMRTHEPNRAAFERPAEDTTDAAIAWLAGRRADPSGRFFLWVHYQDPHGPYTPPDRLAKLFDSGPAGEPQLPLGKTNKGKGQIPKYQALGDERRPDCYRDRYDAEIRRFDEAFGRLIAWLRENGMLEESLIVFTADHGESLGEHDFWFCHGENLHREEVRVPLVVRFPDGGPGARVPDGGRGTRRGDLASLLDVWPTVLEAFGIEPPPNRGASWFRPAPPSSRIAVQTLGVAGSPGRATAVTDARFRLIAAEGEAPRLFDVREDPGELRDLAAGDPARVRGLLETYRAFVESRAGAPALHARVRIDPEAEKALKGLGYVDGDEHP